MARRHRHSKYSVVCNGKKVSGHRKKRAAKKAASHHRGSCHVRKG